MEIHGMKTFLCVIIFAVCLFIIFTSIGLLKSNSNRTIISTESIDNNRSKRQVNISTITREHTLNRYDRHKVGGMNHYMSQENLKHRLHPSRSTFINSTSAKYTDHTNRQMDNYTTLKLGHLKQFDSSETSSKHILFKKLQNTWNNVLNRDRMKSTDIVSDRKKEDGVHIVENKDNKTMLNFVLKHVRRSSFNSLPNYARTNSSDSESTPASKNNFMSGKIAKNSLDDVSDQAEKSSFDVVHNQTRNKSFESNTFNILPNQPENNSFDKLVTRQLEQRIFTGFVITKNNTLIKQANVVLNQSTNDTFISNKSRNNRLNHTINNTFKSVPNQVENRSSDDLPNLARINNVSSMPNQAKQNRRNNIFNSLYSTSNLDRNNRLNSIHNQNRQKSLKDIS